MDSMKVMNELDASVRLVSLIFNFSNADAVPKRLPHREPETHEGREARHARTPGVVIIEPTANSSIERFVADLQAAGYVLVDAFYQSRPDGKDLFGKERYHSVRYTFARREHEEVSEEFVGNRAGHLEDLQSLCEKSFWRVRAFNNPFFVDGEATEERAMNINLEVRQPRYQPNGEPVVARKRDGSGRPAKTPTPLEPAYTLRIIDGAVDLFPV